MGSTPLVSAVIVNWNGAKHLEISLPSLQSQSYGSIEIIVVDNASTDDSAEVAARFGARWVPLPTNIGLAPALNRGADVASGEFLLFLNNDMRFHDQFVESLVSEMLRAEDVFSVDALQNNWEGTKQVHLATRLANQYRENSDCYAPVPGLFLYQQASSSCTPVPAACAASMLVRKSMFNALRGFDERLPLGYEDIELCWRAWVRGWKTIFAPAAVCWHRVGGSSGSGEGSRLGFRGVVGGRLLMATKHLPFKFVITTWLASLAGLARDATCLRGQRTQDRFRVFGKYLRDFPGLLRDRRAIYRSSKNSASRQLQRMVRLPLA